MCHSQNMVKGLWLSRNIVAYETLQGEAPQFMKITFVNLPT